MQAGALGPLQAESSLAQARENQLLQQVQTPEDGKDTARIRKGAEEFEAMLLGSWLRDAEQSFATVPGSDDDEDAAGRDQMMSLGVQTLAQSMAASGGIGIAAMIARAMEAEARKQQAGSTAAVAPGERSRPEFKK